MKKLVTLVLGVLLTSGTLCAQDDSGQPSIMRMVCLETVLATLTESGQEEYSGKVYVIEQVSPDQYDGTIFTDPNPKVDGRPLLTTDNISFNIRMFPNVDNLDNVSSFETLGNQLLTSATDSENPIIHSLGRRSNMRGDLHYVFSFQSPNSGRIYHDITAPSSSHYSIGDEVGGIQCQPPYTIPYKDVSMILNEEVIEEEAVTPLVSQ